MELALGWSGTRPLAEEFRAPDHLFQTANPEGCQVMPHFLRHGVEEVDHMLLLPLELAHIGTCVATPTGQVLRWHCRT